MLERAGWGGVEWVVGLFDGLVGSLFDGLVGSLSLFS